MKRTICLVLIVALLACAGVGLAASAGTAGDPLITKSYIENTYIASVISQIRTLLSAGETRVKSYLGTALAPLKGDGTVNYLNGYTQRTAIMGDSFTLPFGSSLILADGAAQVYHNGALLDTAAGAEVAPGTALSKNVRYLVAEDTSATFTVTSATARVLIEGSHQGEGTALITFSDLPSSHFAYDAVLYFAGQGLVSGMGDNKFEPSGVMTRGMFVTLLGRIYGVNTAAYPGSSFADVAPGQYYAPYVEWASKTGLVKGMGENQFAPNDPITRQQMAKLVVSFADYVGYDLTPVKEAAPFADDAEIADWAEAEVYRAVAAGLINGRGGNRFEPEATANRGEVCTLVYRLITA